MELIAAADTVCRQTTRHASSAERKRECPPQLSAPGRVGTFHSQQCGRAVRVRDSLGVTRVMSSHATARDKARWSRSWLGSTASRTYRSVCCRPASSWPTAAIASPPPSPRVALRARPSRIRATTSANSSQDDQRAVPREQTCQLARKAVYGSTDHHNPSIRRSFRVSPGVRGIAPKDGSLKEAPAVSETHSRVSCPRSSHGNGSASAPKPPLSSPRSL